MERFCFFLTVRYGTVLGPHGTVHRYSYGSTFLRFYIPTVLHSYGFTGAYGSTVLTVLRFYGSYGFTGAPVLFPTVLAVPTLRTGITGIFSLKKSARKAQIVQDL